MVRLPWASEGSCVGQCEAIYWPTQDPSLAHGNRTMILDAFREVREMLQQNIEQLFPRSIAQSY